jgi:hypothetical protein
MARRRQKDNAAHVFARVPPAKSRQVSHRHYSILPQATDRDGKHGRWALRRRLPYRYAGGHHAVPGLAALCCVGRKV